jgi:hypothetical protein
VSPEEAAVKFDHYVVGGVNLCLMYQYPETPLNRLGWMMRKVLSVEDALKLIPYPDPNQQSVADAHNALLRLPPYVFITDKDEKKVGVWDAATQQWSSEFVEDLNFDKEKREF